MSRDEGVRRFYVPGLRVGEVALPDDEARHAARVLRLRTGETVVLFDGRGGVAEARLTRIDKREVVGTVERVEQVPPILPAVEVGFAVPKGKRLDWLLEKGTELGAAGFVPVVFQRSVAGGDDTDAKRERRRLQCMAAAKQSERAWLPELHASQPLEDFLARPREGLRLVGDCTGEELRIGPLLADHAPATPITILVGPEGGFTPEERDAIRAAGFDAVRVGPTVLRVETAVLAMLAACGTWCDDG